MKEAYLLLFLLLLERGWAFTCKGSITRLGYTPDRWNPVVSLNEQPLGQIFQNFESLGELYNAELYILSSIIGTVNLRVTVREETSPHPILDNSWTGHVLGYTDAEVEVEKPWTSIAMHFNFDPPLQLYVGRMYSFSVSAPPGYQDIASTTYIEVVTPGEYPNGYLVQSGSKQIDSDLPFQLSYCRPQVTTGTPSGQTKSYVYITENGLSPDPIHVKEGTQIVWTNVDTDGIHHIVGMGQDGEEDVVFSSAPLHPQDSFEWTAKVGYYTYRDTAYRLTGSGGRCKSTGSGSKDSSSKTRSGKHSYSNSHTGEDCPSRIGHITVIGAEDDSTTTGMKSPSKDGSAADETAAVSVVEEGEGVDGGVHVTPELEPILHGHNPMTPSELTKIVLGSVLGAVFLILLISFTLWLIQRKLPTKLRSNATPTEQTHLIHEQQASYS